MSKPLTHVFVTAAEGRLVPIPPSEATAAGAALLKLEAAAEGEKPRVYVLPWSTYTRRRIAGGDLILTDEKGRKVATPDKARADAKIKRAPDGTVAEDQRPDEQINAERAKAAELEAKKSAAASTLKEER